MQIEEHKGDPPIPPFSVFSNIDELTISREKNAKIKSYQEYLGVFGTQMVAQVKKIKEFKKKIKICEGLYKLHMAMIK